MGRVMAVAGELKSGKTDFSLTFPKPLIALEFDIATVERALWRHEGEDITVVRYPTPLGFGPEKNRDIKGVWDKFYSDYQKYVEGNQYATITFDTATILWWIDHTTWLQEINLKNAATPGKEKRTSLTSKEYGEPNNRMASLIYAIRGTDKNLVLVHHLRPIYKSQMVNDKLIEYASAGREVDGFKYTGNLVDYVMWMELEKQQGMVKPVGEVMSCGLVLSLIGNKTVEPTYDKLEAKIKVLRMAALGSYPTPG